MRTGNLIVLPAPDPKWDRRRLGEWISDVSLGASGLFHGSIPVYDERGEKDERDELIDSLLWLAYDLGEIAFVAGRLLAGKKAELRRAPVGDEIERFDDMVRILGAECASASGWIDEVREGIATRLRAEIAEWIENHRDAEARA